MNTLDNIKSYLNDHRIIYVPIDDNESINKIHDLFLHDIKFEPTNGIECCYIGIYFKSICGDYVNAKKYYLMGIEYGNSTSMNNLAIYYHRIKCKKNLAEKYFLMAIDHGCIYAPFGIANIYEENNDNVNAIKYLEMASNYGNINAMNELIYIYNKINDHTNINKYCILLIKIDYKNKHYIEDFYLITKNEPVKLLKFYLKNHELVKRSDILRIMTYVFKRDLNAKQYDSFVKILSQFEFLPSDELPKLFRTLINLLRYNMDFMKLHFDYSVLGKGYDEAKKDFLDKIKE